MKRKIRIWIIGVVIILLSTFSLNAQPVETKSEVKETKFEVRVEATWIEIPTEELNKYNLDFLQKKDSGIVLPEGIRMVGAGLPIGVVPQATLNELKKNKNVMLISAPGITTLGEREAKVKIARTVHYMEKVGDGLYQLKDIKIGISLRVTATVKPEGMIALNNLNFQLSELVKHTSLPDAPSLKVGQPIIDIKSLQTSIMVKDGQTAVVGGLMPAKEKEGISSLLFITAKKGKEVATSGKIRKVRLLNFEEK